MGYRLTGSSDLYEDDGRRPHASINFVTAHDGFTLRDLVSYEKKRNEANGEKNKDGWDDNKAWNCGAEGPTKDAKIEARRLRQQRNFLVTLMVSQGVPMLTSGDEMGKTQNGNNNAFVQDNEISWLDWDLDPAREKLLAFFRDLAAFRRRHPVFRRPRFFRGGETKDIVWFHPEGREMGTRDWQEPKHATIGLLLSGDALDWRDQLGEPVFDDSFLVLFNGAREDIVFTLPGPEWGQRWAVRVDTTKDAMVEDGEHAASARVTLTANSAVVMKRVAPELGGRVSRAERVRI
jgi:glycogen operon protein